MRDRAGDQPGAAVVGQVEETPLDEHQDAVREFHQVHQVDEQPDQPGYEAGHVKGADLRYGGGSADHGQAPLVEIVERRKRLALQTLSDEPSGIGTALQRYLGNPGQDPALDRKSVV